ncbi:MAG: hypothetical protein WCG94_03020 [Methanothrix sp.]
MRSGEIIIGALLVLAVCSMASATLDAKVYTLCESNLSINLSQGFKIIPDENVDSSDGSFAQGFTIVGSQTKGTAILQIMDVYNEDMKLFGPEFISRSWILGVNIGASMLSMDEDYSDKTIGNWSTLDYLGNNVTVSTITTNGSIIGAFGKTADISNWNIGENKYAGLISFFDRNTTKQIIGSLKVS